MDGTGRNAIWPVLLVLSSVVIVHGLVGVEEVDRTCQSHETCMPNCAFFEVIMNHDRDIKSTHTTLSTHTRNNYFLSTNTTIGKVYLQTIWSFFWMSNTAFNCVERIKFQVILM